MSYTRPHRSINSSFSAWLQPDSRPGGQPAWRISLEDPNTTERSGFKTLTELNAFLQVWMDEKAGKEGDAHEEDE